METIRSMKKVLPALLFALASARIFCAQYRINGVSYDITGMTRVYAISREVEVDTNTIFPDEDAFAAYIADYEQRLKNTRQFDEVTVEYTTRLYDESINLYLADLRVTLDDTFHLLAAPYPRYNSNSGFRFRVRARDSNFLGTMQTMGTNLDIILESDDDDADMKQVVGDKGLTFGLGFDFNYPFQLGFVNATWLNSYAISYTIGHSSPEWNLATGLGFSIPLGARSSLYLQFTQGFVRDLATAYINSGDDIYFSENGYVSLPIMIHRIENWADVYYTPYVSTVYYWDFDGMEHPDFKSPDVTIGQTISTGRVNWVENFRDGISLSTTQYFTYDTERKVLSPKFSAEVKVFKAFEKIKFAGISSDIYFFVCVNGTENFGARMRGIRDGQDFAGDYAARRGVGGDACDTESALVINLDLPIRIFATNFQKNRLLRVLNFELQVSPFLDIALFKNRATGRAFAIDDGFYAGGLEVIVYLRRWRSIQIRGSLGVDVGRYFLKRWIDTEWRAEVSRYEATFGIGLHY